MSTTRAPIALFAYDRPVHLRSCVETLAANRLAAESNLFVFCDAAKNDEVSSGVDQVREFARDISGFRSVSVVEQQVNLGLSGSIISGVTRLVGEYGKVIVVEDDLVLAPIFLQFMNDALDAYANDNRVAGIHGYMFPVRAQLPETFFLRDPGCWGWATWKRAWDLFEPNGRSLRSELLRRNLQAEFDLGGAYPYFQMLSDQIQGHNNSWAVRWYARVFLLNMLVLYPGGSLVRNTGNDASGTHGRHSISLNVDLIEDRIMIAQIPVEENAVAHQAVVDFLNSIKPSKFSTFKHRLILRMRSFGLPA